MDIFLFNRKLLWVTIPLAFWSVFVLFAALDDKEAQKPGLRASIENRGVTLRGRLISATENADGSLDIRLGIRDLAHAPEDMQLPMGVNVQYELDTMEIRPGPPEINLLSGINTPTRRHSGILKELRTDRFVLLMFKERLQVIPEDSRLFRKWQHRRQDPDRNDVPGRQGSEAGPGAGMRRGPAPDRRGGDGEGRNGPPPKLRPGEGDGDDRKPLPPPDAGGQLRPGERPPQDAPPQGGGQQRPPGDTPPARRPGG